MTEPARNMERVTVELVHSGCGTSDECEQIARRIIAVLASPAAPAGKRYERTDRTEDWDMRPRPPASPAAPAPSEVERWGLIDAQQKQIHDLQTERDEARAECARLREGLERIANQDRCDALAGNASLWPTTIARAALTSTEVKP